jgi:hypothetical protein
MEPRRGGGDGLQGPRPGRGESGRGGGRRAVAEVREERGARAGAAERRRAGGCSSSRTRPTCAPRSTRS